MGIDLMSELDCAAYERKTGRAFLGLVLLLGGVVLALFIAMSRVAHAENGGYTPQTLIADPLDRQTAAYRTGIAAVDTTNIHTAKATLAAQSSPSAGAFGLNQRQNVAVSGRASNASATIGIRILYCYRPANKAAADEIILGISPEVTLTASATLKDATRYFADTAYFAGSGANIIYVLCTTAPSAGTFDLYVGSF